MSEKMTAEAVPLLRGRVQQPRRSNYSTVLGLLAAVCLISFFHHRPHPEPAVTENPTEKPWTWEDVRTYCCIVIRTVTNKNRSSQAESSTGSHVMTSLNVQDLM